MRRLQNHAKMGLGGDVRIGHGRTQTWLIASRTGQGTLRIAELLRRRRLLLGMRSEKGDRGNRGQGAGREKSKIKDERPTSNK